MNSLDRITEKIVNDNRRETELIAKNSEKKCDGILADAKKSAEELYAEKIKKAEKKAKSIAEKACSAVEREKAVSILKTKNDELARVLKTALDEFKNLPDNEYFDIIEKLAVKYSREGKAVMRFGKKDTERLPNGFEDRINTAVKQNNAEIEISKIPCDIDSGFILEYGKILWNCSFDALSAEFSDIIRDETRRILFGSGDEI